MKERSQSRCLIMVAMGLWVGPMITKADKLILTNGRSLHGAISEESDGSVVITADDGSKMRYPRSMVRTITKAEIDEAELEALDPRSPERYLEVAQRLAEDAQDDPMIKECVQHLLRVAMHLDNERLGIPAGLVLAQVTDGLERLQCLRYVMSRSPEGDVSAIESQLAELKLQGLQEHSVFAAIKGSEDHHDVVKLIRGEIAFLSNQLSPIWPRLRGDVEQAPVPRVERPCRGCKGVGLRPCNGPRCIGGIASCADCKGHGSIPRTRSWISTSGGGFKVDRVECGRCVGKGKWRCELCSGRGSKQCVACSGQAQQTQTQQKAKVTLPPELQERIETLLSVIKQPPDTSWARELLVHDRKAFQIVAPTFVTTEDIGGRYFRREGRWVAKR